MNPIILFIPFYGHVPPYMSAFLHTAARQKDFVDFCIISDAGFLKEVQSLGVESANIKYVEKDWDSLCELIVGKGLPKPFYPYKLCDYKCTYGHVFEELAAGYEYWGYCDVDVLVGDIKSFLERANFRQYLRIGEYGHFTIYKNTDEMRRYYSKTFDGQVRTESFSYACKTTYPCNYDEIGSNKLFIALYGEDKFLRQNFVHNTSYGCTGCHTWKYRFVPELLTWEDGHVYSYVRNEDRTVSRQEQMYIHFMPQKNMQSSMPLGNSLVLGKDRVMEFRKDDIDWYFDNVGRADTAEERNAIVKQQSMELKKGRNEKFKREVRTLGLFRALPIVITRCFTFLQLYAQKKL